MFPSSPRPSTASCRACPGRTGTASRWPGSACSPAARATPAPPAAGPPDWRPDGAAARCASANGSRARSHDVGRAQAAAEAREVAAQRELAAIVDVGADARQRRARRLPRRVVVADVDARSASSGAGRAGDLAFGGGSLRERERRASATAADVGMMCAKLRPSAPMRAAKIARRSSSADGVAPDADLHLERHPAAQQRVKALNDAIERALRRASRSCASRVAPSRLNETWVTARR